MADIALSAVNQVLGIIREEARLLSGVHSDVQFIMDEMESMNDMLRHLVRIQQKAGEYQFRPYIKQVMELAFDSKNCVVPYMQSRSRGSPEDDEGESLAARLQRLSRLPWAAIVTRHQVATRIRKLKVRARVISERHERYTTPLLPPFPQRSVAGEPDAFSGRQERHARRRPPKPDVKSDILMETTEELVLWLDAKSAPEPAVTASASTSRSTSKDGKDQLNVVAIHAQEEKDRDDIAKRVYDHYKTSSTKGTFELVLRFSIPRPPPSPINVLLSMLHEINPSENYDRETWKEEDKAKKALCDYLRSKKLLLVLSELDYPSIWKMIKEVLDSSDCAARSAVVVVSSGEDIDTKVTDLSQPNTEDAIELPHDREPTNWAFFRRFSRNWQKDGPPAGLAQSQSESFLTSLQPKKTVTYSLVEFYLNKGVSVVPTRYKEEEQQRMKDIMKDILTKCSPDVECMRLFLHALHSYPDRPEPELKTLSEKLDRVQSSAEKENILMAFCYEALPNWCKNCLWYATVTRESGDAKLRRASLVRRWAAQDLISTDQKAGGLSTLEEAECCFEVLLARKLLRPHDVGGAGKVKTCTLDQLVTDMIDKESPTVEDLLLNNQIPVDSLDLLFSLRSGVQLHRSSRSLMSSLRLPTSSRMLLKVLDLEGRKGLKKHRLRNICRISNLKYLSLRNTDVAQLPKQIDELKQLETLDIRQTRVKALDVTLPNLRHLLAGVIECPKEDTVRSKESFSTAHMPRGIEAMGKLEILSRVKVSDSAKELNKLGDKLKQLKKLGVALSGNKAHLKDLFTQIDKLHGCLLSLSIRMEQPANWDSIDAILLRPPRSLGSLNICNIRSGLPPRIKELHQLAKITLRETFLKDDALDILGTLQRLRCLRLRYHSFAEGALTFTGGKFNSLMVLEIEDGIISKITFASGSANKLEKLVWSFNHMEYLSGIRNLLNLKRLERNAGKYDATGLQELNKDITMHPNKQTLVVVENGQVLKHHHAAH